MKIFYRELLFAAASAIFLCSCSKESKTEETYTNADKLELTKEGLAKMFAEIPLSEIHLQEVHEAASASSGNGFDEEYMMKDLLSSPGAGVGDSKGTKALKSEKYESPLKNLISDYLKSKYPSTKAGVEVEEVLEKLSESGYQIYWPYSEDWDGKTFPIITFDPGYGAESNYGYKLVFDGEGRRERIDTVIVNEALAMKEPVWVINNNDDSAFTPLELIKKTRSSCSEQAHINTVETGREATSRMLMLKSFTMLRHYDSWFGGASEFFVKCGSVNGFTAATEAELKLYSPSVTDMMIVVKRKYKGKPVDFNSIIMTSFTNQLDQLVFLITEDDGGTTTSWKCSAVVKVASKSYGFDVDIPYHDKDDIVWRGQLSASFFQSEDIVKGRFGDVEVSFALE